jgi:uncharacterized membrane protein YheB (UPF0754 family)
MAVPEIAPLVLIPVVSGLIGWATNLIAVRMIFRPRKPVRFLGFTFHGLIPKRKSEIAAKIGETVERELISHRDVQEILCSATFHDEMMLLVNRKTDDFLTKKLGANPLVSMLLSSETLSQIKVRFTSELEAALPELIDALLTKVEGSLDFRKIVREKIESFELTKLESMIYAISSRELRAIEVLGGVLGLVIGLVQVGILLVIRRYG